MSLRLCVISHACVLPTNQRVYEHLGADIEVTLVVPRTWRDDLRPTAYAARVDDEWRGEFITRPTLGIGRPQRYVMSPRARLLSHRTCDALIVEEEPFSVSSLVWANIARRRRIPYGVQVAETLPRRIPRPLAHLCRGVLSHAAFVLARSPSALACAREWGYAGPDTIVPHSLEIFGAPPPTPRGTVGFVGRLVDAKGVDDLVRVLNAHRELRLVVAGDGPRRDVVRALGSRVDLLGTVAPESMSAFYDRISVLAVPSRTTPTWSEQFGRVIVEAQERARPVVAYGSGEIPWVASVTAADVVTEGDVGALGLALQRYAQDALVADEVGQRGRALVAAHFSHEVVGAALAALLTSVVRR